MGDPVRGVERGPHHRTGTNASPDVVAPVVVVGAPLVRQDQAVTPATVTVTVTVLVAAAAALATVPAATVTAATTVGAPVVRQDQAPAPAVLAAAAAVRR